MRHAKSDWDSAAPDDFSRPLARRGMRDAARMGRWLKTTAYMPAQILSSSSLRTRQTVAEFAAAADYDVKGRVSYSDRLYHASTERLVEAISAYSGDGPLMVVGHNPGLESLLKQVVAPAEPSAEFRKVLPTAAVYVVDLTGNYATLGRGAGRMLLHRRPKQLSD